MKTNLLTLAMNLTPATAASMPVSAGTRLSEFVPRTHVALARPRAQRVSRAAAGPVEPLLAAQSQRLERIFYSVLAVCAAAPLVAAVLVTVEFGSRFGNLLNWVRAFGL